MPKAHILPDEWVVQVALVPNNLVTKLTHQVVAKLAQEYGFTDMDGTSPPIVQSLQFLIPTYGLDKQMRKQLPPELISNWKLPFWFMAQGCTPLFQS
ncbi:hypothetical protein ACA910_008093 [Epithemia clementina (nom. ined.)]